MQNRTTNGRLNNVGKLPEKKCIYILFAFNSHYFRSYYCVCSQLILTITPPISALPQQKKSPFKSHVISHSHCAYSLTCTRDTFPTILKRDDDVEEFHYVYRCKRCQLPVAYDLKEKSSDFTFLYKGSCHTKD